MFGFWSSLLVISVRFWSGNIVICLKIRQPFRGILRCRELQQFQNLHPGKWTFWTQKWRWMEDDFPFPLGYFLGSMLNFGGVSFWIWIVPIVAPVTKFDSESTATMTPWLRWFLEPAMEPPLRKWFPTLAKLVFLASGLFFSKNTLEFSFGACLYDMIMFFFFQGLLLNYLKFRRSLPGFSVNEFMDVTTNLMAKPGRTVWLKTAIPNDATGNRRHAMKMS